MSPNTFKLVMLSFAIVLGLACLAVWYDQGVVSQIPFDRLYSTRVGVPIPEPYWCCVKSEFEQCPPYQCVAMPNCPVGDPTYATCRDAYCSQINDQTYVCSDKITYKTVTVPEGSCSTTGIKLPCNNPPGTQKCETKTYSATKQIIACNTGESLCPDWAQPPYVCE